MYDIEVSDNGIVGKLVQRSLRKLNSTATLFRYNSHICYATDVNKVFKAFRCLTIDIFSKRAGNLQRYLHKCEAFERNIYPKRVCQIRESPFDKLKAFDIEIAENKTFLNNSDMFDFKFLCAKDFSLIDTEITTWVGKHEPISISVASILHQEPFFTPIYLRNHSQKPCPEK